ncbi:MAG: hypothetical protein WBH38_08350, partial [Defluviitoga tunisiensis]
FNFKTDKERKINLQKLYTSASIENILLKIEEIDRLLKMGENPKVLFSNLFHYICYEDKH